MTRKTKEPTSLQRARKAHADRMKAQGCKPKNFWLTPEGQAALVKLGLRYPADNESALINAALGLAAEAIEESAADVD